MIAELPWLDGNGAHGGLVVSTRVRLARNLSEHPFAARNSTADRQQVAKLLEAALADDLGFGDALWYRLDTLAHATRLWLHERQLVSRELAGLEPGRPVRSGAAVVVFGGRAMMVNEEDHLRIQALRPGLALDAAYVDAERDDTALGRRVSFAFHPEFGYLTSCPTNVGTGLRASVLIHLPGLVLTREIGKVLQGLAQVGLTHRGLWGEGSEVRGNLFQLSNQTTLGKSESELLEHLSRLVLEVIGHEERARDVLRRDARLLVEDRVWRAWAILRHARTLTFDETLNLLSGVRLGVGMAMLPAIPAATLNRLLVTTQDAHVARAAETGLDDEALPAHRANLVRRMLAGETHE
jgi:protein arginine kinase